MSILFKARFIDPLLKHKYIKREGSPGHYKYQYPDTGDGRPGGGGSKKATGSFHPLSDNELQGMVNRYFDPDVFSAAVKQLPIKEQKFKYSTTEVGSSFNHTIHRSYSGDKFRLVLNMKAPMSNFNEQQIKSVIDKVEFPAGDGRKLKMKINQVDRNTMYTDEEQTYFKVFVDMEPVATKKKDKTYETSVSQKSSAPKRKFETMNEIADHLGQNNKQFITAAAEAAKYKQQHDRIDEAFNQADAMLSKMSDQQKSDLSEMFFGKPEAWKTSSMFRGGCSRSN